jgi:methyl-accepting chemotaxis protein
MTITSGLGDTPARCLLLVPLKVDNQVNGVIEIASIEPIAEYKMKFIVKVAESIASTLNGARINERTAMLLEQTKLQGEEMAAAEEEMRQNLEELQSTQEEMNRVQEDQKMAMDKIAVDSHMFDMLLTSTSDYMFFKDVNGKFQRLSDSSTVLLNVQQVEDAIGKTVFDLLPTELATELDTDDQLAIAHKKPIVKMVSRITLVDGTVQNIEKNKYPILNSDGNVIGLTCIYKILANT